MKKSGKVCVSPAWFFMALIILGFAFIFLGSGKKITEEKISNAPDKILYSCDYNPEVSRMLCGSFLGDPNDTNGPTVFIVYEKMIDEPGGVQKRIKTWWPEQEVNGKWIDSKLNVVQSEDVPAGYIKATTVIEIDSFTIYADILFCSDITDAGITRVMARISETMVSKKTGANNLYHVCLFLKEEE
jgi:hypothetical protein